MSSLPPAADERRATSRPEGAAATVLFPALRAAGSRVRDWRTAVGLVVLAGACIVVAGVALFAWLAHGVVAGRTQAVDEAVLRWVGAHRGAPWLEGLLLEVTFLGTMTVVLTLAAVVGLFLTLARQRAAAALLLWATVGAVLLNNAVKLAFDRPRPQLFTWGTHAATTSFPSGHAMSAAAVYGTIAFLAARLAHRRAVRLGVHLVAACLVLAICFSRIYLGVHYPSDVVAGALLGAAWAAFCAAVLEAAAWAARRRGGTQGDSDAAPPLAAHDAR